MKNYEEKFAEFLRLLEEAKLREVPTVIVHHPEVLGDTYEELVESLNRLADANLALNIVPRAERKGDKGKAT
jgi:hypothetical protein